MEFTAEAGTKVSITMPDGKTKTVTPNEKGVIASKDAYVDSVLQRLAEDPDNPVEVKKKEEKSDG